VTGNLISEFSINIAIQDVGEGMSEEHLDMLFRQFENILDEDDELSAKNSDRSSRSHSIGLGLAIVARFVCNNKSQMKIQTKPGVGTRVLICLPMRTESPELPTKTASMTPPTDVGADALWARVTLETKC
jgi:signal transduction histidine kinase